MHAGICHVASTNREAHIAMHRAPGNTRLWTNVIVYTASKDYINNLYAINLRNIYFTTNLEFRQVYGLN